MSIGSYPRVTVQGTGAANNIQNGLGLMLLNPSTGQYEAATASTFAGGGGGGDATAANQSIQISEAQTSNISLANIDTQTKNTRDNLIDSVSGNTVGFNAELISSRLYNSAIGESIAQLLFNSNANTSISNLLYDTTLNRSAAEILKFILQELQSINTNLTNGSQSTQITQGGNVANVNGSNQLEVKSN